ncbi:hypothetical protein D9757_009646 [Collybiopsis confluens]|uniref:Uncharacterized protein n=1 Tax=Collybiopsis confluens TaxID=2823264 RepID=A0A8H5GWC8_9AGAR|nr:hypothetical protein D9757_009646 [Collybiopsis confluens]
MRSVLFLSFLASIWLPPSAQGMELISAQIATPANETNVFPNETFSFDYVSMADQNSGVSSYTCTCWYFTGPVQGFEASDVFSTGALIGTFSLGNYSGAILSESFAGDKAYFVLMFDAGLDPSYRPLPGNLTMPDFSVLPGSGAGERVSNLSIYLGCIEEYGYSEKPSVGSTMSFTFVTIKYNGTEMS